MSKNDFKKKVSKNENPFFLTFFLRHFFFKNVMIIHNTIICKNAVETIRKNAIFWSFSYFFILFSTKNHRV